MRVVIRDQPLFATTRQQGYRVTEAGQSYRVTRSDSRVQVVIEERPDLVVARATETRTATVPRLDTRVVTELRQGLPGRDGIGGADGVLQINAGPVPSGATAAIDELALTDYRSAKWILTVTDTTAGLYRMSEVLAVHDGADSSHSHYGMVGDAVTYRVSVSVAEGVLRLSLDNPHPNPLFVSALRLPTALHPTP